ncbi:lactonase, 7-bladed beta-propeller family protein [Collimonas arenae]|uniref:Lactonase, 7-bladed beta-propeller family protein n=1 Tax=Collimonas arenae TaxID=279058 RepID=A0A127PN98_9BURK|nr:cytochrome D1 domain-containing protein [Collimonas arenae]AMO99223.1 lactonase, 7-bladed beta-propeller family protein [Collimonas arenae]AMP09121.1 lactonase, 7-bladed beta-propeller family protein [Collimonas arenae]
MPAFVRRSIVAACGLLIALSTFAAPATPVAPAASTAGNVVVVLNSRDATITLLDQSTYKEINTFPVGKEPHHLMPTPDNKSLIVAAATGNSLLFLDPTNGQIQSQVKDIVDPYQIGFSPNQKWFIANGLRLDRIDIYGYDGKNLKLAKRLPLPSMPSHMAFTADSSLAFISLQGSDELAAVDLATQKVKWTMPIGKQPAGVYMTPDNKYLLVGVMGSDYVAVVDWRTQKIVKKIKTGDGAHNFRPQGDNRHIFVSNRVSGTINVLDLNTLESVGSIAVPGGPDCMEITADGKTMWVTQRWVKKVSVVDLETRKVIKSIPVGRSPHGIYFSNRAPEL